MAKYITGYCGMGAHEGESKRSQLGAPFKSCGAIDVCECSCHTKITEMYEMAGATRFVQPNTEYLPATNVDLTWIGQDEPDASEAGDTITITRPPVEHASSVAPGLVESARTFTPNADGGRARGQLEAEVMKVCNLFMGGHIDELMTTKEIALQIDRDNPPSQGAIGSVMNRWEAIGYATIKYKPTRFAGYTVEGMLHGLEYMKNKNKKGR